MPGGTAEHDASELFDRFTERLVSSVSTRDEVLGLVLLGSGAQRERLDEWSDHDFYLVVRDEVAEQMRRDLSWLPDPERIVLAPRETAHGLKVVYDDAHVLELAVATLDEVAGFARPVAGCCNLHGRKPAKTKLPTFARNDDPQRP